jgi:hypothetical protein
MNNVNIWNSRYPRCHLHTVIDASASSFFIDRTKLMLGPEVETAQFKNIFRSLVTGNGRR